jgi:hypothetical protein
VKDTHPDIERKFRKMLLERPGEERLKMGCSMHATAQALAKAYILQRHPRAHPAELKRLLFLHFYGADFASEARRQIASALARNRQGNGRERKLPSNRLHLPVVKSSSSVRESAEKYGKKRGDKAKRRRPSSS